MNRHLLRIASLTFFGCSPAADPVQVVATFPEPERIAAATTPPPPATPVSDAKPGGGAECPKCACTAEDLAAMKTKLDASEKKVSELSATPEAIYADLLPRLDARDVELDELDRRIAEVTTFRARFPASAQAKTLAVTLKSWEAPRKALVAKAEEAKAAEAARAVAAEIGEVEDGGDLAVAPAQKLAAYLVEKSLGFAELARMPQSRFEEAMKDPGLERGKALSVSGLIIQIRKEGPFFAGQMCAGTCSKIVYFVTPGKTTGLVEQKRATFSGIVTQRYTYANAAGGATHSILLVGYFDGQN